MARPRKKSTSKVEAKKVEEVVTEEVLPVEKAVIEEVLPVEEAVAEEKASVEEVVIPEEIVVEEPAVKTAAKKASTKKTKITEAVYVQFAGCEYEMSVIMEKVKTAAAELVKTVKDVKVYVKPEEGMAYYVINDDVTGSVEL